MRFKKHMASLSDRRWILPCCAVLYWALYCFFSVDTLFFNGISWKFRVLFLLALLGLAFYLNEWVNDVFIRKNIYRRSITKSIIAQLLPMLALFLIVYPGSWSWDDVSVLEYAKDYRFHGFQHFLTSLYMILCLYFIPSASGATAVQTVVISILAGWTVAKVELTFLPRISLPGRILLRLAFFLPPMLFHNYLFFRNVLCAYIELALLVYAAAAFHRSFRLRDYILLSAATVILCSWRSENIYYLPFFLLYLLFAEKDHSAQCGKAVFAGSPEEQQADSRGISQKFPRNLLENILWKSKRRNSRKIKLLGKILLWISVCGMVVAIGKYNSHVIGTSNYSVLTSACPGIALYREALKAPEQNAEEIAAIEKVLNKDTMAAYPDAGGAELYWTADFINNYTDAEYYEYLSAVFRLILRYPGTFFKERWKIFKDSLGVNGEQVMYVKHTVLMFRENSGFQEYSGYSAVTDEAPLFPYLREKLMLFAGSLRENLGFAPAHYVIWNLIPPILFLLTGCILFLVRKRIMEAACLFALLCKVPVLFLTAPASFFMYYIAIYLIGYFMLFTALASLLKKHEKPKT